MKIDSFMNTFADVADSELHTLRRTSRLDRWPQSPSFYFELTEQLFPGPPEDWQRRQRFVAILRELLYHDGRSFLALLRVAEETVRSPKEYTANGVNALAGISCYLGMNRKIPLPEKDLIAAFDRFLEVPCLEHNARLCRQALPSHGPGSPGGNV